MLPKTMNEYAQTIVSTFPPNKYTGNLQLFRSFNFILSNNGYRRVVLIIMCFITTSNLIFTYYLLYKFIQQNLYIEILQSQQTSMLSSVSSRLVALFVNFIYTVIAEHYIVTKIARKITLSLYTSIVIILLYISKHVQISSLTFFILNLTLCESLLFRSFLNLWQIQLCVELSIMANYISYQSFNLSIDGLYMPIYVLWIFSILMPNICYDEDEEDVQDNMRNTNNDIINLNSNGLRLGMRNTESEENTNEVESKSIRDAIITIEKIAKLQQKAKIYLYNIIQLLLLSSYILIGCTTIHNTIFEIFATEHFTLPEVMTLMTITCLLVTSSILLIRCQRKTKLLIILVLVLFNYVVAFSIKTQLIPHTTLQSQYGFFINILLKKILSLCKCCISSFIIADYQQFAYDGVKFRLIKFIILNTDAISFVINLALGGSDNNIININLVNILLVIFVLVLYKVFRFL